MIHDPGDLHPDLAVALIRQDTLLFELIREEPDGVPALHESIDFLLR